MIQDPFHFKLLLGAHLTKMINFLIEFTPMSEIFICLHRFIFLPKECSPEKAMDGVDAVIVTHLHFDHFDDIAGKIIKERNIPVITQDDVDAEELRTKHGITNIITMSLEKAVEYKGVLLQRVKAYHGRHEIYERFPIREETSGVVLSCASESKKVYLAGDTKYCQLVKDIISKYQPDVIIINGCRAHAPMEDGDLIMGPEGVKAVRCDAPNATLVVVHFDAVPHFAVSRSEMKKFVADEQLKNTYVPDDGETLTL